MYVIVGASGTVGGRVARRLLAAGEPVRAVSRDPGRVADLARLGATPVAGDLRTTDWMAAALEGTRAVVLAAHGLVPPSRDNHPGITDGVGARALVDAAARAGVEHVVYLWATSGAASPVRFGQVKFATEEHLRGLPAVGHTIIRPSVFIETHALRLLAEPLHAGRPVPFFGTGRTPLNWISADDVAEYVVQALHDPGLRNQTRAIGGPDTMSRLQALALVEQVMGRTARRRHVPVPAMRFLRATLGRWHQGIRYLLDMAIGESAIPDDPTWSLRTFDWTGSRTVRDVVEQWAGSRAGSEPAR